MSDELTDAQKLDRIFVAVMDPDTGLKALGHRVGVLESWQTRLTGAWTAVTGLFSVYVAWKEIK